MTIPKRRQSHNATDVVKPLIWFFALKRMELPLMTTPPNMARPENKYKEVSPLFTKAMSKTAQTVPNNVIRIKVHKPAEWRLLDLSQPSREAKRIEITKRKRME